MPLARPSARRRLTAAALPLLFCAALVCGGCSTRRPLPETAGDIPGYLAAPPRLAGEDVSALRGRRILLDPGHGGRFVGAVGPAGLTEAAVNLGVALYLAGMLEWAGAEVHLTRTADVDFLTPADSSLVADLAARVAICDSLRPDVFLSIHHNSTASGDPTINETQTYYPLGREGADLDLARAIHRRLVLLLDIAPARILPGGFHVLRHAPVPAVLGEPAMISNPVIEGRLSLARSLELEAAAYFLGLRDYFRGGTPRWHTPHPDTVNVADPYHRLVWAFDAGGPDLPALDPTTVSLTLDGLPLPWALDPAASRVTLLARDLPRQGRLELHARNLAGRATPIATHTLVHHHDGPWRTLLIREDPATTTGRALFAWENLGQDLARNGPLTLRRGAVPAAAVSLPPSGGRQGWLLLAGPHADLDAWRLEEHTPEGRPRPVPGTAPEVVDLAPGWRWLVLATDPTLASRGGLPGGGWRLRDPMLSVGPPDWAARRWLDPTWPAVAMPPGRTLWLEADGCRPLIVTDGTTPWDDPATAAAAADTLVWQPLLPALVGRRVVIDPQGGGTLEQGRGPFGTRGSDLNLAVARRLAALLRGAGCDVLMLRDDDQHLPDPEKVRRADRFGADLFVSLGRDRPAVRHHPGSSVGAPWARTTAAALAPLLAAAAPATADPAPAAPPGGVVPVTPAYDYVLRHTACPAIIALLEAPATAVSEDRLASPAWQDAEARALLRGLVALLEPRAGTVDPQALVAALGARAPGRERLTWARLDGNFAWIPPGRDHAGSLPSWTDGDGGLPASGDRHVLELHAGPHWQLWTLQRGSEGSWHGKLVQENR